MITNKKVKIITLICVLFVFAGCIVICAFIYNKCFYNNENNLSYVEENTVYTSQVQNNEEQNSEEQNNLPISELEDYYGDWEVIDDESSNVYANVSKEYSAEDIYKSISISSEGIVIDGKAIENPIIEIQAVDEYDMLASYKTEVSRFSFKNNNYKFINIWNSKRNLIIFPIFTDGEQLYYEYIGTYFKMLKNS